MSDRRVNGWVKGLAGIMGSLAVIFAAFATVDSRYAKAVELTQLKQQIQQGLNEVKLGILENRQSTLQREKFDLLRRGRAATDLEQERLESVKRELDVIKEQIDALTRTGT